MSAFHKIAHLSVLALLLGFLSFVGGASSAASATAAPPAAETPVVLELIGSKARINKDGSIVIRWRSRCPETYQGFSYYVRVAQPGGNTYFDVYEAGALVCDGTTRVIRTRTVPFEGTVRRGLAEVEVAAFYYDEIAGSDTEARDFATFKLRRRC